MSRSRFWTVMCAALVSAPLALAQDATEAALEKYRRMLKDDPWSNPGLLDADRGEELWKTKLTACDLGKGPGKVEGAFAELPRFFADADRVMDAETRILWCLEKTGFNVAAFLRSPHPAGGQPVKEVGAIATYVASKSSGMKFAAPTAHPKEKEAVALGDALFNRRAGPFDFSCTTCHASDGARIRLQGLPLLIEPAAARKVIGEWPGYRVSNAHVMTMQHRLLDCYWQMRQDRLVFGSDASVALTSYLVANAKGGEISAPSIKR
ncbi:MAG: sulfur oxidation c-type cytochrome SoxA [Alphaproteobacteria bacterium]|nr:sulfur oxidation c-type cytochrome SoxA [Alphaproteobacteria bacterium]